VNNADVLKLLTPLPLGGDYDKLVAAQGAELDHASAAADDFLNEILPDRAIKTIGDWEQRYGITPAADATLARRRAEVVRKMTAIGGLSRQYFVDLAAMLGQAITIDEYVPMICGGARCGDILGAPEIRWMWTVRGLTQVGEFARCGVARCGEALSYPAAEVEVLFEKLKPAHTLVNYVYDGEEA